MEKKNIKDEFEVLGLNVRFKTEGGDNIVEAKEVVDLVRVESEKLMNEFPNLGNDKVAVLLALNFAKKNISLNREYRENIDKLQTTALDALQFIEEVSPPAP